MSKPILERAGGKSVRQRIWEYLRQHRQPLLALNLANAINADIGTVKNYLNALVLGGYIARTGTAQSRRSYYQLAKDIGIDAPRLQRNGQPTTSHSVHQALWRTLRILGRRTFDLATLAELANTDQAPIGHTAAKDYLLYLVKAGYVKALRIGRGRMCGLYQFDPAQYTGPRPPSIKKTRSVYDPNLDQIVWQETPDHDD